MAWLFWLWRSNNVNKPIEESYVVLPGPGEARHEHDVMADLSNAIRAIEVCDPLTSHIEDRLLAILVTFAKNPAHWKSIDMSSLESIDAFYNVALLQSPQTLDPARGRKYIRLIKKGVSDPEFADSVYKTLTRTNTTFE